MFGGAYWGALALSGGALALAACANEPVEKTAEQEKADAEAIAQVMAQQTPPPVELALQSMSYDDIMADDRMGGKGCAFYMADAEDPVAIAGGDIAFIKYEGSVRRLAPDAGTIESPAGTRAKYDGREYSLRIAYEEAGIEEGGGNWAAPATIALQDGYERRVAQYTGRLAC